MLKSLLTTDKNLLHVMVTNKCTATLSTRGRFKTTLPLVLTSLANQTLCPYRFIIYDDNDVMEDLREDEIYKNLFLLMNRKGIAWEVSQGGCKGQVFNHQRALKDVTSEYIWRLDDDNIMEPDTLQQMFEYIDAHSDVAAVGPLILDPKRKLTHKLASNKIEDIFLGLNIQWCDVGASTFVDVDHLQGSTFLFRRSMAEHGYNQALSTVGHREETIFTYEMKRAGHRLVVLTGARTWHLHFGSGGIRSHTKDELYSRDEAIFRKLLLDWKVSPAKLKVAVLDNGIGDHFAFRSVLPDIKKAYPDYRIILGVCYANVFEGEEGVELISIDEASVIVGDVSKWSVYAWMDQHNWKKPVSEAFKEMYT
jgi:hypothetical protein